MKCLRCGREIGNKTDCECGHFYENNLSQHRIELKKNYPKRILTYIFAVLIIGVTIYVAFPRLDYDKPQEDNSKYYEYCAIKCESDDFSIKDGYCVCTPDVKYPIEKGE